MAKKITQRIALEGSTEFRQGLKNLGDAGQEAFKKIKDSADGAASIGMRLAPAIDSLQRKFKALGESARNVRDHYSSMQSSFRNTARSMTEVTLVTVGLIGGFAKLVTSSGEFASHLAKSAEALDMTTQQLQEMTYAANLSDVGMEGFQKVLTRLNSVIAQHQKQQLVLAQQRKDLNEQYYKGKITDEQYLEGQQKLKENSTQIMDVFNRLGTTFTDANGQLVGGQERLYRLADAMQAADKNGRGLIATELGFSRQKGMVNLLDQGRAGIMRLVEESKRIAPALTPAEVELGVKLNDSLGRLQMSFMSVYHTVMNKFAPAFTALFDTITQTIVANRTTILEYAQIVSERVSQVIADLIRLIQGKEVDPNGIVGRIKSAVESAYTTMKEAAGYMKEAWDGIKYVLDLVADAINAVFGTNISGEALAIVAIIGTLTGVFTTLITTITFVTSVIGFLATAFGGVELAIAAVGFAVGYWFTTKLVAAIQAIPDIVSAVGDAIKSAFSSAWEAIKSGWDAVWQWIKDGWNTVVGYIESGIEKIKAGLAKIGFTSGGSNATLTTNATGHAEGGHITGPGTSTSDSIPAWLSDGEYVVRASAVKHYGVSFLEALNNFKLPPLKLALGGLLNVHPGRSRFATGGLALAAAGPTSKNILNLSIDGQRFEGLISPDDTFNKLTRYASQKQITSAGRKPSHYR